MSEQSTDTVVLDPHIAGWLARATQEPEPATLAEARENTRRNNAIAMQSLPASLHPASEEDRKIDGPDGAIPVRVIRPAGIESVAANPTIVYFHGGGWVLGDIDTHLGNARRLATQAGAVVVTVGYRLAPEHRFPAAFDDAVAATEWAWTHRGELGGADGPLVTAGDGVGGQLAASVAIARRDAGAPLAAHVLLYPVTDVAGCYEDAEVNAHYMSRRSVRQGSGLTVPGMANLAHHYVDAADAADWRISPIRCEDLSGVAPAVVHTATLDVLRTEGNFYAEALQRSGVRVIGREFPTVNHSYFGIRAYDAIANSAAAQAAEDLAEVLGGDVR